MAVLLDLSPELISSVLDNLAPHSLALKNLCLVGNHNLLSLARPYTWREINITLCGNGDTSRALAERVRTFCTDPLKAAAVRSLNITFRGIFDFRAPAVWALYENFPRLVNATHAYISCSGTTGGGLFSQPQYVMAALQDLPALLSLSVDGCLDRFHRGPENMAERPVPKLKHLSARLCNPEGVGGVWTFCSNLEVVELAGGFASRFLRQNSACTTDEIKAKLDGEINYNTGVSNIVYGACEAPERPVVFDVATTIKLLSDTSGGSYYESDSWFLADYFEERLLNEGPSPSLKELVLDLSISVKAFRSILSGVRSPIIERIGVTTTLIEEEERSSGWVSAEWDEFLVELSKNGSDGLFFAGFESLTELLLPCDGVSPETLNLFPTLLAHAPALRHLYFSSSGSASGGLIAAAALKYAEAIPTLQSVSWRNRSKFHIVRDSVGDNEPGALRLREMPYMAPSWQGWNGIGQWWEV